MAFKMKGFNPGEGTGMGSAFTKASPMKIDPPTEKKEEEDIKLKRSERPSTKEIRAAEYKAVEGSEETEGAGAGIPDYEDRYSKEEIAKGASTGAAGGMVVAGPKGAAIGAAIGAGEAYFRTKKRRKGGKLGRDY